MLTTIAARYDKVFTMDVKVKQMGRNHQDSAQVFIGSEYFLAVVISAVHGHPQAGARGCTS